MDDSRKNIVPKQNMYRNVNLFYETCLIKFGDNTNARHEILVTRNKERNRERNKWVRATVGEVEKVSHALQKCYRFNGS